MKNVIILYIIFCFFAACKNSEEKIASEPKPETMYWSDQDSTILYKEDYNKLIALMISDDSSDTPFLNAFAEIKSKPKTYNPLAAMTDLGWVYIRSIKNLEGGIPKEFENISIKRNKIFEEMKGESVAFTCYTESAPIDDWISFGEDGIARIYTTGVENVPWSLQNDTLTMIFPEKEVRYLDKDSLFVPVKGGHTLFVLWRNAENQK
jgi:hypothetical protein